MTRLQGRLVLVLQLPFGLAAGALSPCGGAAGAGEFASSLPARVPAFSPAPVPGGRFGHGVAKDGDVVLVGATAEPVGGEASGAAHVFRRGAAGSWEPEARLAPEGWGLSGDLFGAAVAVSGSTALVGFPGRGNVSGGAAFFSFDGAGWREVTRFFSGGAAGSAQGSAVALLDDYALVGAALGSPEGIPGGGVVFSYRRDYSTGAWVPGAVLDPGPGSASQRFGASVALSDRWAAVGATGTPVRHFDLTGSVYLYTLDPATGDWRPEGSVGPPFPDDSLFFGSGVAMSGGWLAVGATSDDEAAENAGAVHLYRLDPGASRWIWRQTLQPPPGSREWFWGRVISLSGGVLAVGSPRDDRAGGAPGSVLLYRLSGERWEALPEVFPGAGNPGESGLGEAVAVSRSTLLAGLPTGFDEVGGIRSGRVEFIPLDGDLNRRPRFVSEPVTRVDAGVPFRYDLSVVDPDGEPSELSAPWLPDWLGLVPRGPGRASLEGAPGEEDAGVHQVRLAAEDASGLRATQSFWVEVLSTDDPPVIAGGPSPAEVFDGQRVSFVVAVVGSAPLAFQWFKDGRPIPGSGAELVIGSTGLDDAGSYHVVVTNPLGSASSAPAELTVREGTLFGGDWPTFGGGADHTGSYPASLRGRPWEPLWEVVFGRPLQQVAAAAERLFVVPRIEREAAVLYALDPATGAQLWRREFDEAFSLNPPSYFGGRVYLQRVNRNLDTQLWSLDAATGEVVWRAPHSSLRWRYFAPAVTADHVWVTGGFDGGIYGFDRLTGEELFYHRLPQYHEWTPTVAGADDVYSWVEGVFVHHHPTSGERLWSVDVGWDRDGLSIDTTTATAAGLAYAIGRPGLFAFDLGGQRLAWSDPGWFRGSPAVAQGAVYAFLMDGGVAAFDAGDGRRTATFATPEGTALIGQPLVTNDTLIAASESRTFVFSLRGGRLLQEIPHGGALTPYDGLLLIASPDGLLRAYRVRTEGVSPPAFLGRPAGRADEDEFYRQPVRVRDPDAGDSVRVTAEGLPPWLSLVENQDGTAWLEGTPALVDVGLSEVTLRARDTAFNRTSLTFDLTVRASNDPPVGSSRVTFDVPPGESESFLPVGGLFSDEEDPGEELVLAVASVRGESLPGAARIGPGTDLLRVRHRPEARGSAEVTIRATDPGGLWAETVIEFRYPEWIGPVIEAGPAGVQVGAGGTAIFSVGAAGEGLTYQWRRDGADLPGATGSELRVGGVAAGDAGAYTVVVSNAGGSVESVPARLQVDEGLPAGTVNRLPVAAGFAPVEAVEDGGALTVDLAAAFSDPDGGAGERLTFTVRPDAGGELFTGVSVEGEGRLVLAPAPDAHGAARLTVRATDALGGWAEAELPVLLRPVNDPPATTGVADLVADPAGGGRATVDLRAAFDDPEDGAGGLEFRLVSTVGDDVLSAAAIDGETAELSLRFRSGGAGSTDLRLRATDRLGLSVETVFRVTVAGAPAGAPVAAAAWLEDYPADRDRDADGFSDLAEIVFGSAPMEVTDRPWVRIERQPGGGIGLAWSAAPGYHYRVEVSVEDPGGAWVPQGVAVSSEGGVARVDDRAGTAAGARFFRVVVEDK